MNNKQDVLGRTSDDFSFKCFTLYCVTSKNYKLIFRNIQFSNQFCTIISLLHVPTTLRNQIQFRNFTLSIFL
jgi:hypothetical protein